MTYRLIEEFQNLFVGKPYLHRKSNQGDFVAMHIYEDLFALAKSSAFTQRVRDHVSVLNVQNRRRGVIARRGDGSFGELVPGSQALVDPGFSVARGQIATVELGVEVKILMKAMIKQIDRVVTDLLNQVQQFKRDGSSPICMGIVGINSSEFCRGYEGDRSYLTDGKSHRHPIQEADDARSRIESLARPAFDELVVLSFRATNDPPFLFSWTSERDTTADYAAALTRVSRKYQSRFSA